CCVWTRWTANGWYPATLRLRWSSPSDSHVGGSFVHTPVFHTPPLFPPTYITSGFEGSGAAASMRPAARPSPTPAASIGAGPIGNQLVVLSAERIVIAAGPRRRAKGAAGAR